MTTDHEKEELVEVIKGSKRIDWHATIEKRQSDIRAFKDAYEDGDAIDEKFFSKHSAKIQQEIAMMLALCQQAYPDEGYIGVRDFDITILITPRK